MIRPTISYSNILLFSMIAFILADLYFGYSNQKCIHSEITNAKVGFGLDKWLKLSGFTGIVFLLFPLMSYCLGNLTPTMLLIYMVLTMLYSFFRFIWIVIGGIIWKYLWSAKLCQTSLSIYMWINLIYSFIILFVLCWNQQQIFTTTYVSKQQSII